MTSGALAERSTPIRARDKLIVALDVGSVRDANIIIRELGDAISFYKIGPHLLLDPDLHTLIAGLKRESKNIFLDLKVFDIPATVEGVVGAAAALEVNFITVAGQQPIMRAAAKARGTSALQILVVTLLTYMNQEDLKQEYGSDVPIDIFVRERARFAQINGCNGVISSPNEVRLIRDYVKSDDFVIVTPGIRPSNAATDDQKRIATPYQATLDGSDYLVIGRPIIRADNRLENALKILDEMQSALDLANSNFVADNQRNQRSV